MPPPASDWPVFAAVALRLAVQEADRPGDIVLVAGKGHEDYQLVAGRVLHFDDREELLAAAR